MPSMWNKMILSDLIQFLHSIFASKMWPHGWNSSKSCTIRWVSFEFQRFALCIHPVFSLTHFYNSIHLYVSFRIMNRVMSTSYASNYASSIIYYGGGWLLMQTFKLLKILQYRYQQVEILPFNFNLVTLIDITIIILYSGYDICILFVISVIVELSTRKKQNKISCR